MSHTDFWSIFLQTLFLKLKISAYDDYVMKLKLMWQEPCNWFPMILFPDIHTIGSLPPLECDWLDSTDKTPKR